MITTNDAGWIARTVYGEARGEGRKGMRLVAEVIINRMDDPRWPDGAHAVVTQPRQFSAWNQDDPNRKVMFNATLDDPVYRAAWHAVLDAIGPDDPTHGADHYFASWLRRMPRWARSMTETVRHGLHRFFKG